MHPAHDLHCYKYAQRGTALVMTLVFLVLLTMLGITAINTSTLEERMAGNSKDQNLSFQAAETALRAAEAWVESTTTSTQLSTATLNDGIHAPSITGTEIWNSINWNGPDVVTYPGVPGATATGTLGDVTTRPKFIIELVTTESLSPTGTRITARITARGTGASDNTVSMVQSNYQKTYP